MLLVFIAVLLAPVLAQWLTGGMDEQGFVWGLSERQLLAGVLVPPAPRSLAVRPGRYRMVHGQLRRVGVVRAGVSGQRARIERRWHARGGETQLPPLAGGTVNIFKTSGKWNTPGNWSKGTVPKSSEDVEIEAGKECELITTAGKCLSFTMPSTAKFVGSVALEVGGSTEPRAGGVAKRAVSIASGAVVSWTGKLELVSTYKTGELGVLIVPELKGAFQIKVEAATATYILEEALLSSSSVGLKNTTEGGLNTNGQKVECSEFSVANKAAVSLGKSELLDLSSWTWSSGGSLTAGESLIRVEGGTFTGGGQTYNNVTLKGAGIEVKAVGTGEGTDTFKVLKLETKGLAATKVHEGVTLVVTTLECNGTEAEPCIIESAVAEQKWKIKAATNQTVKYLKVKDSKAETSSFTTEGPSGKEAEYLTRTEGWTFKAHGEVIKLEAACTATSAASASIKQGQRFTGTAAAVTAAIASVRQGQRLGGTAEATSAAQGKVHQGQRLGGTAEAVVGVSAAVKLLEHGIIKLEAACHAVVAAAASVSQRQGFGATSSPAVTVQAKVSQAQRLGGTAAASSSATGRVTLVELFKAALRAIVTILGHKQATVTVSGGPQATITVVNHRSTVVEVENSPQATITIVNRRQAAIREV